MLIRTVGGEHVLYNPDNDEVHTLDAVGSIVWDLLVEHPDLDELVGVLADRFGQPLGVIERDVLGLLARLQSAGLVEAADDVSDGGSIPDTRG